MSDLAKRIEELRIIPPPNVNGYGDFRAGVDAMRYGAASLVRAEDAERAKRVEELEERVSQERAEKNLLSEENSELAERIASLERQVECRKKSSSERWHEDFADRCLSVTKSLIQRQAPKYRRLANLEFVVAAQMDAHDDRAKTEGLERCECVDCKTIRHHMGEQ